MAEVNLASKEGFWGAVEKAGAIAEIFEGLAIATGRKHGSEPSSEKAGIWAKRLQQVPHLFGLGKADERIWAGLLITLTPKNLEHLNALMSVMTDKEREQFRLVTTGIVAKMEKGSGDGALSIEYSKEDVRVKFLVKIIGRVQKLGANEVVKMLRDHQLIGTETIADKGKKFVADILGVSSYDEVTIDLATSTIAELVDDIEAFRAERRKQRSATGRARNLFDAVMMKYKVWRAS